MIAINKERAADFLTKVIAGDIEQAFEAYVDMGGTHHNLFTPAGFEHLMKGMQAADEQMPHKTFEIKHVFGDGDLVAIHSHLIMNPGEPGMAAVHMFRFEGDRIVEMWDVGQAIPGEQVNSDGGF